MITISQHIRDALAALNPKKAQARLTGLDKYLDDLNSYVSRSMLSTKGLYRGIKFEVPLEKLKTDNIRITVNDKKPYLHDWLLDNYPLFIVYKIGNNFTHKISEITLTNLATYEDPIVKYPKYTEYLEYTKLPIYDLDDMLDQDKHLELFNALYPELRDMDFTNQDFDYSPIDTVSLRGYIEWLPSANKIELAKKQDMYRKARMILAITKVTNGILPQYKHKSPFGRTYYRGLNLQGMYKSLRYAALGECYQYDIRSSAITWKMKFAKEVDPNRDWKSSILFLEDKNDFINDTYNEVFRGYKMTNSKTSEVFEISKEDAKRKIKDVLNAISFGAKITAGGRWYDEEGNEVRTAINDIIPDKTLRNNFLNFWHIKRFIEDQKLIDDYLYNRYKDNPKIKEVKTLFDTKGKIIRSKLNAFLYQQAETKIMNTVHQMIEIFGKTITGKIHDAVILDQKLSFEEKQMIEMTIREEFQIPLWTLTLDQHTPYNYISKESKTDKTNHEQFIIEQERLALNYKSVFVGTTVIEQVPTMEDMLKDWYKQEKEEMKYYENRKI